MFPPLAPFLFVVAALGPPRELAWTVERHDRPVAFTMSEPAFSALAADGRSAFTIRYELKIEGSRVLIDEAVWREGGSLHHRILGSGIAEGLELVLSLPVGAGVLASINGAPIATRGDAVALRLARDHPTTLTLSFASAR